MPNEPIFWSPLQSLVRDEPVPYNPALHVIDAVTTPEPDLSVCQPGEVLMHRSMMREFGFPNRSYPANRDYRIVSNIYTTYLTRGRDYFLPEDDLPNYVTCNTCSRRRIDIHDDGRCGTCHTRRNTCIERTANGGRRFGIELEFSLPPGMSAADNDDGEECYDDYCDCFVCRHGRSSGSGGDYMSAQDVAELLSAAGLPCIAPGYTHEVYDDTWKIVTDGSVRNGYELVSPPLQWCDRDQITLACDTLRDAGMMPTDDCGLHVHHDVGDLDVQHARLLAQNWSACLRATENLVDDDRIGSEWCHHDELSSRSQCAYDGDDLHQFLSIDYERYRPLNWTCWHNYGTVEVRMHESTLDAEAIIAWIAYTQGIIENSMNGKAMHDSTEVDEVLNQVTIHRPLHAPSVHRKLRAKAGV